MSYLKSTVLCLVKIKSPDGEQVRLFEKSPFVIGRDQSSDLLIAHSSISRKHLLVNFDGQSIKIQDAGGVNGTYHCGQKVRLNSEFSVQPNEHIRLGLSDQTLEFQVIPRPLELDTIEEQKSHLKNSLKDVIQSLKGHARAEAQTELQQELQKQKEEYLNIQKNQIDQEIRSIKEISLKEIEKEKDLLVQKKNNLLSELKEIESQFQDFTNEAKLSAEKRVQEWLRESQNRLQEEEKASLDKITTQQREAQEKIQNELRGVQNRVDAIIAEARKEAENMRDTAQTDSKNIRKQAAEQAEMILSQSSRDGENRIKQLQNDFEIHIEKEKTFLLEKTKSDCEQMISDIKEKLQGDEKKLSEIHTELSLKSEDLKKTEIELDQTSTELEAKKKEFSDILKQVQDAESIIKKSFEEKKNLQIYAQKRIELENEAKKKSESLTLEYAEKKRTLEKELSLLAAQQQESLKNQIREEEKRIKEVRKAQASEIARMIEVQMADRAKAYIHDTKTLSQFSQDLFATVRSVLSTEETSLKPLTVHLDHPSPISLEKNKKYIRPVAITFATTIGALLFFYRLDIYQHYKSQDSNSVAKQMIDQRKIQSIYSPEQNGQFRNTYMDNVLYFKHYSALKANQDFQQKWTLRLNDMTLIRELKVTEDRMVQFQAIEANLVLKLSEMKTTIDAVYLTEGLEAMRKLEAEEMKRILEVLKGQSNFEKIRELEKEFIQSYLNAHKLEFP